MAQDTSAYKPLKHTGTVRLETARLILRQTTVADAEQMYANYAADPEVTKYLMWKPHASVEVSKGILADWDKQNAKMDYYHWGIVLKETGQLIGAGGSQGINEINQSTELGYCLGRMYWGKGLMSEAVAAMIAYLFGVVGLHRIFARYDPHNIASGRVMEKCGMIYEGTHRHEGYSELLGFYDLAYYAILKDEWEALVPKAIW